MSLKLLRKLLKNISGPQLYIVIVPDQMPDFSMVAMQSNPIQQQNIHSVNLQSVPAHILSQISAATGITSIGNMNMAMQGNSTSQFRPIYP